MTARTRLGVLVLIGTVAGLVAPPHGGGQTLYRWTDEQGQTHMTDDPNQVPEGHRPKPPPVDTRVAARAAVDALKALTAIADDEVDHEAYMTQMAQTREAVSRAVSGLEGGALRTAMSDAMRCYAEAGALWDNQLKVRRSIDLPLNRTPIRRAWRCGAERTAEAERLLAARK
jgi:hypothetical protein